MGSFRAAEQLVGAVVGEKAAEAGAPLLEAALEAGRNLVTSDRAPAAARLVGGEPAARAAADAELAATKSGPILAAETAEHLFAGGPITDRFHYEKGDKVATLSQLWAEGVYLGRDGDHHLVAHNGFAGVMQWPYQDGWIMPLKEAERRGITVEPPYVGPELDADEKAFIARMMGDTFDFGSAPKTASLEHPNGTRKQ